MKCVNMKIRSKDYKRYFYCTKLRKEIGLNECNKCDHKVYKFIKPLRNNKPLNKTTPKQRKKERTRFSIITDDLTTCIENKYHTGHIDKHEIYRGKNRTNSIKYGLVVPLCRECHDNHDIQKRWMLEGISVFCKFYNKKEQDFYDIFQIKEQKKRT